MSRRARGAPPPSRAGCRRRTEYTWILSRHGAVRMVLGVKDEQPFAVEATTLELTADKVRVRLMFLIGEAVVWEDVANLVRATDRSRVIRLLLEKGEVTLADTALVALAQACRTAALPREPQIGTATADPARLVPLADLLAEIEALITRYVIIPAKALTAIVLWVAHTYVLDAFDLTPYLNVSSPAKRCGKSRLLEVLHELVVRPWFVIRPSEAVLFRKIARDTPTLLLDEVDAIFKDKSSGTEGLRALLNAGNRRGVTVPRCVGDKQELVDFPVFCAKVLAGIGSAVPDTVRDRSVEARLVRKKPGEKLPRLRAPILRREAAPTREALAAWASPETIGALRVAEPSLPDELHDRAADAWEPLLAIADLAGGTWPAEARAAARTLHGADLEKDSASVLLLCGIRDVFDERHDDRLPTVDLLHALVDRDGEPWGAWWGPALAKEDTRGPGFKLAGYLREYGITSKEIRFGDRNLKGYERADFEEVFARYAPPPPPQQGPDPQNPAGDPSKPSTSPGPPLNDATTLQPAPEAALRAENDATAKKPVASSNGAETLAGQGLSRCSVVEGGDRAGGQPGGTREPGVGQVTWPPAPCPICRRREFWSQSPGVSICSTCHPNPHGATQP